VSVINFTLRTFHGITRTQSLNGMLCNLKYVYKVSLKQALDFVACAIYLLHRPFTLNGHMFIINISRLAFGVNLGPAGQFEDSKLMNRGAIRSISISRSRGQFKTEVPEAILVRDYGIEGDAHAGKWGRQVSCLDWASVEEANREHHLKAGPGDFAENILIEGIDLSGLSVGSRLKLGADAVLQVTQIGKEDHPSIVSETLGVSLLPGKGVFCKVVEGGLIRKGDPVEVL